MSLLSSSIGRVRCLADEEADHNMLQDLQLAAELGKTLLERNKELENCIKLHQCTIDDQAQEIEYMKKQTAALREVNDSRLKIYEQLEVSIQDLERANQRLALENTNDKKQIKSQCLTIDTLETRLDELQKKYDQLNAQYKAVLREQTKSQSSDTASTSNVRTASSRNGSTNNTAASPRRTSPDEETIQQLAAALATDEDVTRLLQQLQEARSQRAREQKRVAELKEQIDALLQEQSQMEEQLNAWKSKAEDIKNLQDEINTLEEVRQGHLCGRCLRGTNSRAQDELSVMLDGEEDDEISLAESLAESLRDADTTLQELSTKTDFAEEKHCNTYRELVEKYEALLKVQQNTSLRRKPAAGNPAGALSLQEELQMSGEFNNFNSAQSEIESNHENGRASVASVGVRRDDGARGAKKGAPFACTPTDFSEAETSSSGFADETSNKATQTEGRPGSFLCSIADGDDCKLSIYDDSSTFESRFHKTPEYRKLFSEIFQVLKRAAEAKDEGTELPLLDDSSEMLTPKNEQCPAFPAFSPEDAPSEATDDNRSIVSLAVSSVVSEPVFRVHTPVLSRKEDGRHGKRSGEQPSNASPENQKSGETVLRPIHGRRHQPLEYISVQVRKKSSAKKSKRLGSSGSDCPATPDVIPTPNPRVTQLKGRERRKFKPLTSSEISDGVVWNGATAHFYPSKSPRGRHHQSSSFSRDNFASAGQDYKPGTAAEEVAKLRRLEMSYAEVLRMPNKSKGSGSRHRKNH